ncbi:MAG: hypothetical protein PVF58_18295 [Candidatus Methanofastidiosia archaeon]|jgi:hypothetical protein
MSSAGAIAAQHMHCSISIEISSILDFVYMEFHHAFFFVYPYKLFGYYLFYTGSKLLINNLLFSQRYIPIKYKLHTASGLK